MPASMTTARVLSTKALSEKKKQKREKSRTTVRGASVALLTGLVLCVEKVVYTAPNRRATLGVAGV
jgi:hypothetical protein